MRNASIIMGLVVGMIVAGGAGYVDGSSIKSAPVATFFWVHTFKLRIYAPAILPMMAVYVSLTMEVRSIRNTINIGAGADSNSYAFRLSEILLPAYVPAM